MSAPPRLWAVTPPLGTPPPAIVDAWREAGAVDAIGVWLRTPGASPTATLERCAALLERARSEGLPVVLGCDIAAIDGAVHAIGARGLDGIVLRGDPDRQALLDARRRLGPRPWIGRSIHARPHDHDVCTWSVLGPVFGPHTAKPHPVVALGTDGLAFAASDPVARLVAIGGVDGRTADACIAAGAWGLAGIRSFFGDAAQVVEDVASLRTALRQAKHGPTSP